MDPEILYEDNDLLVLNKPAGMLSQEDHTGDLDVVRYVKRYITETTGAHDPFVGLVHRLDRPASGLMVLALTPDAARALGRQFRERFADKQYLALVEGTCTGLGQCEDFILKENQQVRIVSPSHPEGKRAELSWQSLHQHGGTSLLLVQLHTGRPHQVRVQLADRGFPILGDMRYGAEQELDGQNIALHASRLAIEHPTTQKGMRWSVTPPAIWPADYESVINRMMKN